VNGNHDATGSARSGKAVVEDGASVLLISP